MNDINYYSQAFPVSVFPESRKIYGFKLDDFQKVLDALFCMTDLQSNKKYFKKPANIVVAETNKNIFIGISFEKAILRYTSLGTINKMLNSDEDAEKYLRTLSIENLGFNLNCLVKLPIAEFKSIFANLLFQFNSSQKTGQFIYTFDEKIKQCIAEFQKGIQNSGSIYGGNGMWINPIFKARDLTVDPNMCFCVLPFSKERLEIFDEIIKPTLEDNFDINVIRSGNIFGPNLNIMETIWTYINQSAFVIVDLSEKNPNVFYELGICHTLGKPVITLCDQESYDKDYEGKLPFDISTINTIFYKNSGAGPQKMVQQIVKNVEAIRSGKPYIE